MKSKFSFLFVLAVLFVSCRKESVDYLRIEGITEAAMDGPTGRYFDPDDWNLNDQFTKREKQLFEGLDFSKTAEAEPVNVDEVGGIISEDTTPRISFGPNPFCEITFLCYYRNDYTINLVIVDNHYNKLFSYRGEINQCYVRYWLQLDYEKIYRMYYVMQDKNDNIVHCGHGDILKSENGF